VCVRTWALQLQLALLPAACCFPSFLPDRDDSTVMPLQHRETNCGNRGLPPNSDCHTIIVYTSSSVTEISGDW
jgi:hypothetical protein